MCGYFAHGNDCNLTNRFDIILRIMQKQLGENDYFAEYCVLYDHPRPHPFSVKAMSVVSLLSLSAEAYHDVLDQFPSVRKDLENNSITLTMKNKLTAWWEESSEASHLV